MLHVHVLFVAPLGASHMTQPGADQHQSGVAIGECPHHTRPAADLPVQSLDHIVGADPRPVLAGKVAVFGYWGKGLKFLVAFLNSYGWLTFNVRHGINIPSPMLFTFLIELIPVFMAVYLVSQAPSGKLTAALRQLPLPSSVRLTVIVILRFVPTVASEFSDVLDAMKTRGLLLSPLQVVLHPLNTFEYVVVPMVFRSLKIADELAASSVVRGIESPYKKEGYYLNKMAVSDGVMIALFISTAAMCILV